MCAPSVFCGFECNTRSGVDAELLLLRFVGYSQQGSIKCPDGACNMSNVSDPGLNSILDSPGPVKVISIVVKSIIARCSINVFSPNSAGKALSSTVGVVNMPSTTRCEFFALRATGKLQSWVHVWQSLPTPETCKGLSLRFCSAFRPLRPARIAVRRHQGVPLRFPHEPGSMRSACRPSANSVLLIKVCCRT